MDINTTAPHTGSCSYSVASYIPSHSSTAITTGGKKVSRSKGGRNNNLTLVVNLTYGARIERSFDNFIDQNHRPAEFFSVVIVVAAVGDLVLAHKPEVGNGCVATLRLERQTRIIFWP